ncbi:MAG: AAA family ATPase [Paramuribaculum sp.]|nr:AAA family ATPase [Paramuribaculum sp.]
MLRKIIIDNFKSIRHCETEFGRINLLIGENGAGKSNLISFIELAQTGGHRMRNYVLTHLGMSRLLHGGIKKSKVISGTLIFEGEGDGEFYCDRAETDSAYSISIGPASDGSTPVVIEEAQYCDIPKGEPHEYGEKLLLGGIEVQNRMTELKLRTQREVGPGHYADVRTVHFVRVPIHSINIYHFQDTGNMSAIRGKANIDDNKVLKKDGENLASMLYLISQTEPRVFKMIEMMMRRVAPYFRRFDLQPDRMNPRLISIEWKENDSDVYLDSTSFSDGTIRFLAICVALIQPNTPKTIIIEFT